MKENALLIGIRKIKNCRNKDYDKNWCPVCGLDFRRGEKRESSCTICHGSFDDAEIAQQQLHDLLSDIKLLSDEDLDLLVHTTEFGWARAKFREEQDNRQKAEQK